MLFKLVETNIFHKNVVTFNTLGPIYLVKTVKFGINFPSQGVSLLLLGTFLHRLLLNCVGPTPEV